MRDPRPDAAEPESGAHLAKLLSQQWEVDDRRVWVFPRGQTGVPPVIHLLNRTYDAARQVFVPRRGVNLTLHGPLAAGMGESAWLLRPEAAPLTLPLVRKGTSVQVRIPELPLWGMLVTGSVGAAPVRLAGSRRPMAWTGNPCCRRLRTMPPYAFAGFPVEGPVAVESTSPVPLDRVQVRPAGAAVVTRVDGNRLTLTIAGPTKLSIEPDGRHGGLLLFADEPETEVPDPDDPKIHYYGPGLHCAGVIKLGDGETLYLAPGAVVEGGVCVQNAGNVRIMGRGILCGDPWGWRAGPQKDMMMFMESARILVEGITLRCSWQWTFRMTGCRNITIRNLKLFQGKNLNDDGIAPSSISEEHSADITFEKLEHNPRTHINLPVVDISGQTERHVFVARGNQIEWNGHPSTVLLPDGKTIFCVWQARRDGTRKHGAPGGYVKRSDDGGQTWSEYLDLPANWREIGRGSPTIQRLVDGKGKARLFVFCRDESRSTFLVGVSEDDGATWSELRPIGLAEPEAGPITGWTAPITILEATAPDGRRKHLMWYEQSRDNKPEPGVIWQSASYDGGLTWGESRPIVDKAKSCEPACIRSPDGKQLLLLIREESRQLNSLTATSDDEGKTWSAPCELPTALRGDRHLPRYAPDGRLVIIFRPVPVGAYRLPWDYPDGYCTVWVGRYEDLVAGREGECLIRLLRSHRGADHTYPGLELLPDGSFVATTYIQYQPDELQSIVSVRFRLDEIECDCTRHQNARAKGDKKRNE